MPVGRSAGRPRWSRAYVVAVDWQRIGQELPLLARAADRGDDLGSQVLLGRLTGIAMHLGFLLHRRWPPYPKWLGTMFARLPDAAPLARLLTAALTADGPWSRRLPMFTDALEALFALQRDVGLPTGPRVVEPFWDRGFPAIADSVVTDLLDTIADEGVRSLPRGVGSIEQ